MRRGLLASTAVGFVRRMAPVGTPAPANILKYLKPGQTGHIFITRVAGESEVTVLNNVIIAIDGLDVGGYGLRYTNYLKMNEGERSWARLTARAWALHDRTVGERVRTGIVMPLVQNHLNPGVPWFPRNLVGMSA